MAGLATSLSLTLTLLLPLLVRHSIAADEVDCSAVQCPRPLCANPVVPEGECCPSCENSNCKFEGCVNFLSDGTARWAESPCKVCQCDTERNQKFCFIIDCFFPTKEQCFGRPVVFRPNECCPSCDFGIPEDKCSLVPQFFGRRNITVGASNTARTCTEEVVGRGCDKIGYRSGDKRFRCQEVKGRRFVRFDKNCPLSLGVYEDNVRCTAVRDDNLRVGCDLVVPTARLQS